jgi:hypothetical protein
MGARVTPGKLPPCPNETWLPMNTVGHPPSVTLSERRATSVRRIPVWQQEERQSGLRFLDVRRNLLAPHTPVYI